MEKLKFRGRPVGVSNIDFSRRKIFSDLFLQPGPLLRSIGNKKILKLSLKLP